MDVEPSGTGVGVTVVSEGAQRIVVIVRDSSNNRHRQRGQ